MSKTDGWTPEAARAVVERNGPAQGALMLSRPRTEAVKQQECVWWLSGRLDGGPCGRCLRCEAFRAPYDCPSDVVEKPEPIPTIGAKEGSNYSNSMQPRDSGPQTSGQNSKRLTPDAEGWVELTIPGEPVAKGRVRARMATPKGKAPFVTLYTPKETEDAEKAIAAAWRAAGGPLLGGRLELVIRFFQTPQKNRAPRHEDVDNLGKLVMDALNNLAWPDDRNVSHADLWKLEDEHNPRTVIRLRVAPE